jgi:chromosomal replication initiation ATPase DnaA
VLLALTTCRAIGKLVQRIDQRESGDRVIRPSDIRALKSSPIISSVASGVILRAVSRYFKLSRSELVGPSRRKTLVRARGLAICLLRDLGRLHWKPIAALTGRVDHSTALHAYRKTKQLLNRDPLLADAYQILFQQLSQPGES